MYDILQLNDMLVPELLDIAEQLKIPNAKKLDKQEMIYKILDRQAVIASEGKGTDPNDKTKRKRIVKATTGNSTEEAIVESDEDKPGVILDYDALGNLVSLEILDASKRVTETRKIEFETA